MKDAKEILDALNSHRLSNEIDKLIMYLMDQNYNISKNILKSVMIIQTYYLILEIIKKYLEVQHLSLMSWKIVNLTKISNRKY